MNRDQPDQTGSLNQSGAEVGSSTQLVIDFSPRRVIEGLIVIMATLLVVHVGIQLVDYLMSPNFDGWKRLDSLFNLAHEANFPTYFTSFLLLLAAIVIGLVAIAVAQSDARLYLFHWALLAVMFLGLSIEEHVQVHEFVSEKLEARFDPGGIFSWAWVIPGLILTIIVALVYLRFLFHLPRRYQLLLCLAATLYVGSAIGLEMISASYSERLDHRFAVEWILIFFEETGEMAAVLFFIYTFLTYLECFADQVTLSLGATSSNRLIGQAAPGPVTVSGQRGFTRLAAPADD